MRLSPSFAREVCDGKSAGSRSVSGPGPGLGSQNNGFGVLKKTAPEIAARPAVRGRGRRARDAGVVRLGQNGAGMFGMFRNKTVSAMGAAAGPAWLACRPMGFTLGRCLSSLKPR
jgi:hypothetical protein